jgi:hypothetical protein
MPAFFFVGPRQGPDHASSGSTVTFGGRYTHPSFARPALRARSGCAWISAGGGDHRRILGIVALCVALGGCAGTDTHLRMLENSNVLQVEPSQSKDFDYVVRMKNLVDIGYESPQRNIFHRRFGPGVGIRRRNTAARSSPAALRQGRFPESQTRS